MGLLSLLFFSLLRSMPAPRVVSLPQAKEKRINRKVASDACIGAYVTFNEAESWKRCLLDYGSFGTWWYVVQICPSQAQV